MARSFTTEGVPKEFASSTTATINPETFWSSYSEYRNVNDKVNLLVKIDNNDDAAGTALTLELNNGVIVTLTRANTKEAEFTGSYIIGPNDTLVAELAIAASLPEYKSKIDLFGRSKSRSIWKYFHFQCLRKSHLRQYPV